MAVLPYPPLPATGSSTANGSTTGNFVAVSHRSAPHSILTGSPASIIWVHATALPRPCITTPFRLTTTWPTITTSYEIGTEFSLFKNRLWGDINFYSRDTKNQIIEVTTSSASGYSSWLTNAGLIRNRGYEISLGGKPIKTRDWEWEVDANIAHNSNKLVRLVDGMNRYLLSYMSFFARLNSYAEVGKPLGALYTSRNWAYNENGKIIISQNSAGEYVPTIDKTTERYLGNIQPKFTGGFSTSLRWKDLSVRASFDYRIGGKVASVTNMWLSGSWYG